MRRGILSSGVLLLAAAFVVAGSSITGLKAESAGGRITVSWQGVDESGVSGYAIERRAGMNGSFIHIADQALREDKEYRFEDNTAFRTSGRFYTYRIKAVGTDQYYDVSVIHESVSSVRKTWGSIKAMFR